MHDKNVSYALCYQEDLKLSPMYTYKKEYNINVKSISQGFAFIR